MAIALAAASVARSPALADGLGGWTVTEVRGKVVVRHGVGAWMPVATGHVLPPGTRVKSGADGRLSLRQNGDTIDVSPESAFKVPMGDAGVRAKGIVQTLGTLLFKVVTRPSEPFSVKTPYLAAVIKGTTFTVTVRDGGAALHVTKGAVEVKSLFSGEVGLVRPGQTATVSARPGTGLRIVDGAAGRSSSVGSGPTAAVNAANDAAGSRRGRAIPKTLGLGRLDIPAVTRGLVNDGRNGGNKGDRGGKGERNVAKYGTHGNSADPGATTFEQADSLSGDGTVTQTDVERSLKNGKLFKGKGPDRKTD